MNARDDIVFLFDCDNTLLDNDRVHDDLDAHLRDTFGSEEAKRYWRSYEELRATLGYADYLGAVQRFRLDRQDDPRVLQLSGYLLDYPFADRLYPGALEVLARLRELGPTIVLTDGDAVFQPSKVARAGIGEAADALLVYVHKEDELEDVERRFPAGRYVLVDDKVRILAAAKLHWGERVTTVLPKTGQFANDPDLLAAHPVPDVTIEGIGDLLDRQDLLGE